MTVRDLLLRIADLSPDTEIWISTRDSEPDQCGCYGYGLERLGLMAIDRDGDLRLYNDEAFSDIVEVL